jgi:cysteine desulfurase/selenocysteine lyase
VLIDGAQSVAHIPVNLQQLGCDFFVFSGHKIFGPTGIGVAYIKEELHDILPPWQGGGNMIRNVTFEETTYSDAPARFEAGTPNIADAVGLGAALDYVNRLGLTNIAAYEHELLQYATEGLARIGGLRLIGTAREKVGVISFVLPTRRSEDVGRLLDQEGIAVRSGHHCSQPSLRRFGVETTVRPSLSLYNTKGEIDRLVDAVKRIQLLP